MDGVNPLKWGQELQTQLAEAKAEIDELTKEIEALQAIAQAAREMVRRLDELDDLDATGAPNLGIGDHELCRPVAVVKRVLKEHDDANG
jgi:chaperonin cofactor prefoldin